MDWRKTPEYRKWRIEVIRRDTRCKICNSLQKRDAHHINDGSSHALLRFDINNGVTLCHNCHTNFHTNFKSSYRQKCTDKDWNNFINLVQYIKSLGDNNET